MKTVNRYKIKEYISGLMNNSLVNVNDNIIKPSISFFNELDKYDVKFEIVNLPSFLIDKKTGKVDNNGINKKSNLKAIKLDSYTADSIDDIINNLMIKITNTTILYVYMVHKECSDIHPNVCNGGYTIRYNIVDIKEI